LLIAVVLAAVCGAGAKTAAATNECRGLQVCVRVHGPWVLLPATSGSARRAVQFQLSCPRGFVVGGLDAELSDRAIDIDFPGLLGSPVGPGTTTSRSVVFRGLYTGAPRRTTVFRPHIGCLPAAGGGAGPVPFRRMQAFAPGQPTIRRVRTVSVRPGTARAVAACAAGERLVSGWRAVGFYSAAAPGADILRSVTSSQRVVGNRVSAVARASAALRGVRTVLQAGAVCGGGS